MNYAKGVPRDKPDRREGKDLRDVKRLINRLIGWLKAAGFTDEQITACIEYITRKAASDATADSLARRVGTEPGPCQPASMIHDDRQKIKEDLCKLSRTKILLCICFF
jgi:hypothetical protein